MSQLAPVSLVAWLLLTACAGGAATGGGGARATPTSSAAAVVSSASTTAPTAAPPAVPTFAGTQGAGTTARGATPATAGRGALLPVVAAENVWGSIAAQLGGDKVEVRSIIVEPNADPHNYEAKPSDARLLADAKVVIVNGAGYDPWSQKLIDANPVSGRTELDLGKVVGKKAGDNPHLWYNPDYVAQAIAAITSAYKAIDPGDAAYFDQQRQQYVSQGLKAYRDLLDSIQQRYGGVAVASTESIVVYTVTYLGLDLITPPGFMKAVNDGVEPTAQDKATFSRQLAQKRVQVLVFNRQNSTPDTDALRQQAQQAGIPVVSITETLDPPTMTFQDWQAAQLRSLQKALGNATGR